MAPSDRQPFPKPLSPERLAHLRTAAEVGQRLAMLGGHTVQLLPAELAALIDRDEASVLDVVKLALAGLCSCERVGCVHDAIRGELAKQERSGKFAGPAPVDLALAGTLRALLGTIGVAPPETWVTGAAKALAQVAELAGRRAS